MLKKLLNIRLVQIAIAVIVKSYISLLFLTCRINLKIPQKTEEILKERKAKLFLMWHGRMMVFAHVMKKYKPLKSVVSHHRDAASLGCLMDLYGYGVISGSSRKGATNAMRGIIDGIKSNCCLAITPDGPKGPIFEVNGNLDRIAKKMDVPIILACSSSSKAWVVRSWDRFIIPKPFSKIYIEFLEPFYNLSKEEMQEKMLSHVKKMDKESGLKVDYGI